MSIPFTLMAKPSGPRCNLRCEYCFYLEKEQYFAERGHQMSMSDELLEAYVRQYLAAVDGPEVAFAWQGGEPTLMGLAFFKKAVMLQRKYGGSRQITNSLQTNGILLNDEWCRFLADNRFLVGLSLDGPRAVHDRYRKDRGGKPTFTKTVQALERLQKHRVEFNLLACINRASAQRPQEVYRFFREHGANFIQFIPVVEQQAGQGGEPALTVWSVDPEGYGRFLTGVFEEWIRQDVGRVFVMNFEWTLASWMGVSQTVCTNARRCGESLILEYNGDIYSCDHFMYPEYRLGNILHNDLQELVMSERQREFGARKETALAAVCRHCSMRFACNGGCPKQRFGRSPDGEPGVHYLCSGIRYYLEQVTPAMQMMAELLRKGLPVSLVMENLQGIQQRNKSTGGA